jgi:glycosidase
MGATGMTSQRRTGVSATDDAWWKSGVIYQVYPRSFQDSNGDGVGDLAGVISRLPYLGDLGVDALWLSPFYRLRMDDFGYDVSDHRAVDPLFGAMHDFRRLVLAVSEC